MIMKTEYYIDYIYGQTIGENFYHQLVRTRDEAILFASRDLKTVIWYAKIKLNINGNELTIL